MKGSSLNSYGDVVVSTTGAHGSDISSQRFDDLDKACLDFVKTQLVSRPSFLVVDIGGGFGAQSKRMAELGADVFMVDLVDRSESIRAFNDRLGRPAIRFVQKDVRLIEDWPLGIGCVYSQRMINYLPFEAARNLLSGLVGSALPGAGFFVSSGGIDTEYGRTYADRDAPLCNRFSCLSAEMAHKHDIKAKVCLYRENELCDLLHDVGLGVERSWTSAFGNPKVVAVMKASL